MLKKRFFFFIKLAIGISMVFTILFFTSEFFSNLTVRMDLKNMPEPSSHDRILLMAPHNDDEALSSAGYLKKCKDAGASVKIVFMTNGDGFLNSAEIHYKRLRITPKEYISFGELRQQESIHAMSLLGISSDDLSFLGFPDGGVRSLLLENWSSATPFKSPYTGSTTNPYPLAFRAGLTYSGEALLGSLTEIMNTYRPTMVLMPHPNDRHPDHWATHVFTELALRASAYPNASQYLYLVHRGDWPVPMKKATDLYLVPPQKLKSVGTVWLASDLDQNLMDLKATCIDRYQTQKVILGPLMDAFKRKNELYGQIAEKSIPESSEALTAGQGLLITDPVKDTLTHEFNHSTDILGVYGAKISQKSFQFAIRSAGNIDKDIQYKIYLFYPNMKAPGFVLEMEKEKSRLKRIGSNKVLSSSNSVLLDNRTITSSLSTALLPSENPMIIGALTVERGKVTDTTAFLVFH